MAGDIAAEYASAPVSGYQPESADELAARALVAAAFRAPTPEQVERLSDAEQDPGGRSDEESISRAIQRLLADDELASSLYLSFLRRQARATVGSPLFQGRLELLEAGLLEHYVSLPSTLGLAASVKRKRSEGK